MEWFSPPAWTPASRSIRRPTTRDSSSRCSRELNPLSRHGRMMRRRFHGRSHDETLDSAGRVRVPQHLVEHADLAEGPCVVIGVADHLEIWNTDAWADARRRDRRDRRRDRRGARRRRAARAEGRDSALAMATLTYMRTEHVPVLADRADRRSRSRTPARRRRLHLRRRRPRAAGRRAPRARRDAGLHRSRPRGRAALRRARRRGRLRDCASSAPTSPTRLRPLRAEGVRADLVYMDLGISSIQLDAAERGLLLHLRRAARHAHGPRARRCPPPTSSTSGPRSGSPG